MPDKMHPQNEKKESLSFQDITAEIGEVQMPLEAGQPESKEERPASNDIPGGTSDIRDAPRSAAWEERLNRRVLTGSAPKPRPMWFDGLMSNLLAGVFILPVIFSTGFRDYQPWISYMAVLLAVGASIWSLLGLKVESDARGKVLCVIGATLGVIVIALALLFRAPAL